MRHNHSIIAYSRHIYVVLFFAHISFVVNHTFNATPAERLQQPSLLFTTNRADRTFFLWRLHLARPSHRGHSTILLRSESPSVMCAKLRTVAASNNRDHAPQSLYYCLFAPHISGVVLRAHPARGESHIHATPTERLQQFKPSRRHISTTLWASSSIHCLAALDFGAGVEQPFSCLIVQNRQGV